MGLAPDETDGTSVVPMTDRRDITYFVHIRNIGWQEDPPGTIGRGLPIEAITFYTRSGVNLCLRAHVQNIGWQSWQCTSGATDKTVGTTGRGLQIEALQIKSSTHRIEAYAHQAVTGDLPWVRTTGPNHVVTIGSVGQNRGLEYVEIINRDRY